MIDNLDSKIISAIIGAIVALISTSFAYWFSHRLKLKELALKELDLRHRYDTYLSNIEMKNRELKESYQQNQESLTGGALSALTLKRIELYPKLWRVIITYGKNWKFNGNVHDGEWANKFLKEINDCNCECGVYFSKDVYLSFHKLRSKLHEISALCGKDDWLSDMQINEVNILLYGDKEAGLCALLKDDLGNYKETKLSIRRT